MRDQAAFAFARPNVSGDAVSILVIVEDSPTMLAKWSGISSTYLPSLLYSLRMADPAIAMRVWWCTTSMAFAPFTTDIPAMNNCTEVPDLHLGYNPQQGISTTMIQRSIEVFMAATRGQQCTRHCIVIASQLHCGPVGAPTSSQQLAMILSQEIVRFHLIIDSRSDVTHFDDLFQQTLYLQGSKEVPIWFQVDPQLIIRLSCAPEKRLLEPLKPRLATTPPEYCESLSSPEQYPASVASSSSTSGASTSSLCSLSSVDSSEGSRPSTASSSPARPKKTRKPTSGTSAETPGLVTILQQYHGLTKKRTYGAKPAKRSLTDIRQSTGARPILPRLDTAAQEQAQVSYTLPSYGTASLTPTGHAQRPEPSPSPTHTQPTSLVERSIADDRRARRVAPYPIADPLPTPEYPPSASSSAAALRSLEAMIHTEQTLTRRSSAHFMDSRTRMGADNSLLVAAARQRLQANGFWSKDAYSAPASPLSPSPPFGSPTNNGWSPLGEALLRPVISSQQHRAIDAVVAQANNSNNGLASTLGIAATAKDSAEDQPFLVTPEYEAYVEAQFAQLEAIRQVATLSTTADLPPASAHNGKTYATTRPRSDSAPVPTNSVFAYSRQDGYGVPAGDFVDPHDWSYAPSTQGYEQQPVYQYSAPAWPGP